MTTSKISSSRINTVTLSIVFLLLVAANISTVESLEDLTTIQFLVCGPSVYNHDPYFVVVNELLHQLVSETPNRGEYTTSKTDNENTVYGFADCVAGYSPDQCSVCLRACIEEIFIRCGPARGAEIEMRACGMKYDDYKFYY